MNLNVLCKWLLVVAICFFMGSCQRFSDNLLAENETAALKVKTRSVDDREVVYPLTLYVFSSDGSCIDTRLVEEESEEIQLKLAEGNYRVVVVSACKDGYLASSIGDWEDVIEISEDGGAYIPLVMGKADVKVASDTKGRLDIVLSNAVTAVDVALSNIPSDVMEVVVAISPFYTSVNLKGEYVGSDYLLNLPCSLDTSNRWSAKTRYLFPGSGKETVLSIWMKKKNGEEATYGYIWKDFPKVNQPYHLLGDYSDGLVLNGSFVITAWNEAKGVEFQFGAVPSSSEQEVEHKDEPDVDLSGLPEIGGIWNGTIVADVVEADESGVDVLLMSLEEWETTSSQVENVTFGYVVNKISDWRLPTYGEAVILQKRFSGTSLWKLNETIAKYDSNLFEIASGSEERYLCNKNGVISSFQFIAGTVIRKAGDVRSYYVRLVKNYRIEF